MVDLQTVGRRFESELFTETGYPFPGVIMPLDEGAIASYDFTEPRFILRVRNDSPVHTGMIIMDPVGRKFIMADHDEAFVYDVNIYRTHRLFHVNKQAIWQREAQGATDALTGLKKSAGKQTLGTIDVLIEAYGREDLDTQIRVKEQRRRLVTSASVRLGDIVDNMVIKRLDKALGIWLAEIE
jgi:hypothetical protein